MSRLGGGRSFPPPQAFSQRSPSLRQVVPGGQLATCPESQDTGNCWKGQEVGPLARACSPSLPSRLTCQEGGSFQPIPAQLLHWGISAGWQVHAHGTHPGAWRGRGAGPIRSLWFLASHVRESFFGDTEEVEESRP